MNKPVRREPPAGRKAARRFSWLRLPELIKHTQQTAEVSQNERRSQWANCDHAA
jgi:hypothetical protein